MAISFDGGSMRKEEVPQDRGLAGDILEVTYAVNDQGRYELVQSYGWEAKNITLTQAWDVIARELSRIIRKIKSDELSPLAFHMAKNQMNVKLLAKYMRMNRFRVKRHLRPEVFRKLKPGILKRYAVIFGIEPDQLSHVPDEVTFDFKQRRKRA